MAITLKYGAPGPILAAGFAAGVGRRQQRQQKDSLEIWQQQQQQGFQAQQAQLGRDFQAGQAKLGRDFQADQGVLNREFQAAENKAALDFRSEEGRLDRGIRMDLTKRLEEFRREEATMEGVRTGELILPPAAETSLKNLESARVASLELDPAGQAEFMEAYEEKKAALLQLAQPRKELGYDERVKKNLGANYGQYKSLPWQFNQQGEMSLPSGFKMPQEEDPQGEYDKKFNDSVMKQYEKNLSETDEAGDPLYKDEDAALQAAIDQQNKIERGRQRLMGGQADDRNVRVERWTGPEDPDPFEQPVREDGQGGKLAVQRQPEPAGQGGLPSPEEFDKQWAEAKPGQSVRGADGKWYKKKG